MSVSSVASRALWQHHRPISRCCISLRQRARATQKYVRPSNFRKAHGSRLTWNLPGGLRTFGRLTWQPFEERFERDLKAFRKNLDILEQEMRHADRATNKIAVRRTDEAQQKIAAGIDDLRITSTRAEQSRNADQARTDIQQKKMIAGIDKLHSDSKRVHGMIDGKKDRGGCHRAELICGFSRDTYGSAAMAQLIKLQRAASSVARSSEPQDWPVAARL